MSRVAASFLVAVVVLAATGRAEARDSVAQMIGVLRSGTEEERKEALRGLAALAPSSAEKIPLEPVVGMLKNESAVLRAMAANVIEAMGPTAREAIPSLLAVANDDDMLVRTSVIRALGAMGEEAVEKRLLASLKDVEPRIRLAALGSLRSHFLAIGFEKGMVPVLLGGMKDPDWRVREGAADLVTQLVRKRKEFVPALLSMLAARDESLEEESPDLVRGARRAAIRALGFLGRHGEPAVSALIEWLTVKDEELVVCTAEALGKIGPRAEDAAVPLATLLKHRSLRVKRAGARALAAIGPVVRECVGPLTRALADRDPELRLLAAMALARVGSAADKSARALKKLLKEKDPRHRASAARALGAIGPKANVAGALLEDLAESDPDEMVREAAKDALEKIRKR